MLALRDCPIATIIWNSLVKPRDKEMLFSSGETTWLLRSLSACDEATAVVTWSTVFGATIWYWRKFRNQRIFANDSLSHTCPLNVIKSLVADIKRTNEVDGGACSNMK